MANTPQTANVDMTALAAAIAQGIATIAPQKEIKEGDPEYVARQRAEGWFDDFFGKTIFQNAYEAQARGLSEDIRRKASQLKPGKYIKNRVTVEHHSNGEIIRLLYPVSGDNMMINQTHWRDFSDLIEKIWAEMHVTA